MREIWFKDRNNRSYFVPVWRIVVMWVLYTVLIWVISYGSAKADDPSCWIVVGGESTYVCDLCSDFEILGIEPPPELECNEGCHP